MKNVPNVEQFSKCSQKCSQWVTKLKNVVFQGENVEVEEGDNNEKTAKETSDYLSQMVMDAVYVEKYQRVKNLSAAATGNAPDNGKITFDKNLEDTVNNAHVKR